MPSGNRTASMASLLIWIDCCTFSDNFIVQLHSDQKTLLLFIEGIIITRSTLNFKNFLVTFVLLKIRQNKIW